MTTWPRFGAKRKYTYERGARVALLGAAALLTAACSAPESDPLGASRAALATPFANDQTAYDYFVTKGLTSFQAAGIVGNLDQESGVNPSISQSGGGVGRGIAQWSTGGRWDTNNNDNVLAYAAQQGQSATSLALQLDFIWYELQTFPDYGLAALRATTNVSDASIAFEDDYEGCVNADFPECAQAQRITYAMGVLNAYGSDPVQGGAGAGGSSGASSGGTSGSGGASAAGAFGSGGASGGTSGSSGAGAPSSGGSPSAAGSGAAGGPTTAGSGGEPSHGASASSGSSCAFAAAKTADESGSFAFGSALLVLGLAWRVVRRRR